MRIASLFLLVLASLHFPAFAEDKPDGWSGEGSFSAGTSTGNTETSDLGLGLKLARTEGRWRAGTAIQADFGETDGEETKNRIYLEANGNYQLNDTLFTFAQASFEKDEFSGFENRYFIGGGLGWNVIESDRTNWSVKGGPGLKVDEVRPVMAEGDVVTPAETVESFSVIGSSEFSFRFNESVSLTNTSTALYAEESTQLTNSLGVTASLTDTLSGRVSYDVRHDTNPPLGFEKTDTVTRVSIVYKFGG